VRQKRGAVHSFPEDPKRGQRGITGLETAIVLIAFVVVASVVAFTILTSGLFAAERSDEAVTAGLKEVQGSLEPKGSAIAYTARLSNGTVTVFKVTFRLSGAIASEPVDLTPPYSVDDFLTDPDVESSNEYTTVISYVDTNQFLADVPWTVSFIGNNDGDFILEARETAELTVWLLDRNTALAVTSNNSIAVMDGGAEGGDGGFDASSTVLKSNGKFTIEINPPRGAVLNLQRTLPSGLDTVVRID
jgi:flagellin FlaB